MQLYNVTFNNALGQFVTVQIQAYSELDAIMKAEKKYTLYCSRFTATLAE